MAEGETVGLHQPAVRNLLSAEEIGDHQLRTEGGAGVTGTGPPLFLPPVEGKYSVVNTGEFEIGMSLWL